MDCYCFNLVVGGEVLGFSLLYMDRQCFNERRFYVAHYSVKAQEWFERGLQVLMEYFWNNDPASEMRVALYHYQ